MDLVVTGRRNKTHQAISQGILIRETLDNKSIFAPDLAARLLSGRLGGCQQCWPGLYPWGPTGQCRRGRDILH